MRYKLTNTNIVDADTRGITVNNNTTTLGIRLVSEEDEENKSKIKEALQGTDWNLRSIILRDNPHLVDIIES